MTEAPAELQQKAMRGKPTAELHIQARTMYIQGKGSCRVIAERLGLVFETVRNWQFVEDWQGLREEFQKRQLARLMGTNPQPPEAVLPATTPQQNQEQAKRLAKQLQAIEEQMEGLTNPASLRDLSACHARLFDAYCTLTGIPRPGTRRQTRSGARPSSPPVPTEPDLPKVEIPPQ